MPIKKGLAHVVAEHCSLRLPLLPACTLEMQLVVGTRLLPVCWRGGGGDTKMIRMLKETFTKKYGCLNRSEGMSIEQDARM